MHLFAQFFEFPGLPLHTYLSIRDLSQCMVQESGYFGQALAWRIDNYHLNTET